MLSCKDFCRKLFTAIEREIWPRGHASTDLLGQLLTLIMRDIAHRKSGSGLVFMHDEMETNLGDLKNLGKAQEKYGNLLTL